MKVLFALSMVACVAQAQVIQTEPVYVYSGHTNYLQGDIPAPTPESPGVATHCGGFLHEGTHSDTPYVIPNNGSPVQSTQPKCKINITGKLKVGTMTWYACSHDWNNPVGGGTAPNDGCNGVPLQFTVVQGPPPSGGPVPLAPPSNSRVQP